MPADLLHSVLANTWYTFLVILFFGGSIFVHELGHFLAARIRGVKVDRFSIGFGPAIWSWTGKDGVKYMVAWIPLGGYVALPQLANFGAVEGASSTDASAADTPAEEISYSSKMIVFAAGATFNVLFAFLLACVITMIGQPETNDSATTRLGYVSKTLEMPDGSSVPSPASVAGLHVGDKIVSIDGQKVSDWNEVKAMLVMSSGRDEAGRPKTVFTIERDGRTLDIPVLPRLAGDEKLRQVGIQPALDLIVYDVTAHSAASDAGLRPGDDIVALDGTPTLSVSTFAEYLDSNLKKLVTAHIIRAGKPVELGIAARSAAKPGTDFGLTFSTGLHLVYPSPFSQVRDAGSMVFRTLSGLINPRSDIGLSKMSGPVGIVRMLHGAAEAGIGAVLMITIVINVNLAILNLLPIPVLDGGQMVFATIGRFRRKALPSNFILTTQSVFFALIFSVILYVSYFDVRRMFHDPRADRAAPVTVEKP